MAEQKDVQGKITLKEILKYPIMVLFFLVLGAFSIADALAPDQEMSEFENRKLQQFPAFTWTSFVNNDWTKDYGEYVRDQFLFRDQWVSLHNVFEVAQGKLESGGVWFAADGYQIAKNSGWSAQQERMFPMNKEAVVGLAQQNPGRVSVMVVPSPAYMMRDALPWQPHQIDEAGMTDEMNALFRGAGARVIDLREAFAQSLAAGEQVYYRTDHHWTTDGGAWLAYTQYCEALGLEVKQLPVSYRVEVAGFLGTNYMKTKRIGTKADTLVYYDLPNQMDYTQYEGAQTVEDAGLMDYEKLDGVDKYAAFLHGNNGYSVIQGEGEGSVLVVKDSYGNCFVPYLTQNYAQVCVVDLRNWTYFSQLLDSGDFDDILVLYSFSAFTEDGSIINLMR